MCNKQVNNATARVQTKKAPTVPQGNFNQKVNFNIKNVKLIILIQFFHLQFAYNGQKVISLLQIK